MNQWTLKGTVKSLENTTTKSDKPCTKLVVSVEMDKPDRETKATHEDFHLTLYGKAVDAGDVLQVGYFATFTGKITERESSNGQFFNTGLWCLGVEVPMQAKSVNKSKSEPKRWDDDD